MYFLVLSMYGRNWRKNKAYWNQKQYASYIFLFAIKLSSIFYFTFPWHHDTGHMALNKTAPVFACVLPSCQVPVFSPASFGEAFYPRIFCRIEISDCSPQKDTYWDLQTSWKSYLSTFRTDTVPCYRGYFGISVAPFSRKCEKLQRFFPILRNFFTAK